MISDDTIKKTICKNITKYRKLAGLSQKEFASKLGAPPSRVSSWETGANSTDIDTLFKICEILNVSINDMMEVYPNANVMLSYLEQEHIKKYRFISTHSPDGANVVDTVLDREHAIAEKLKEQAEKIQKVNIEFSSKTMRPMAYYQRMASAGSGEYLFNDIPTDVIEVPDTPLSRRANFVLGVNGDSMETTYFDGDKVLVKKAQDVPIGAIGVFLREGECFIKEAGKDRLISHNKDKERYPDIIPDERRIDTVGIVLGKIGE